MAEDDKENSEAADPPSTPPPAKAQAKTKATKATKATTRLPPKVERALEAARAAAKADRARKGGRWLAIFPVSVGVILLLLMMPRATPPDAVPIPRVDERVIQRVARTDDARAAAAERDRLPTDVLALGSAFREMNRGEAHDADESDRIDAKHRLDRAHQDLPRRESLEEELLSLRALQTRRFLDAVAHWEATGEMSEDLAELGGNFIVRLRDAGWVEAPPQFAVRRVLLNETQRRVAFKTVWNALVGVDSVAAFAPTLDEQRALYVFYIQHPHPPDSRRLSLESQRKSATTPQECAKVNGEDARQKEIWRAEKIKKLAAIDPLYPAMYALGVVYYRAGRFDLSAEAFNAFITAHPDGPLALRAKNHLKAAVAAGL